MAQGFQRYLRLLLLIIAVALVVGAAGPMTTATAQDDGQTTHVVQRGENLFRISLRYGTTVQAIVAANNIANPNLIFVGQTLIIPDGTNPPPATPPPADPAPPPADPAPPPSETITYTVQRGDFLGRIATRFNTTIAAIVAANNIANPNLIFVGQVLIIPVSGDAPSQPPPGNPNPPPGDPAPPPSNPTGFALGGHVVGFGAVDVMRSAGMTWAKVQIRWNRGEGTGAAANVINQARANGLNILLGVVGNPSQMGDYEAYTNEFAAYLGQVAALGPDAIEVWNEPNLTREWPAGQVNGGTYTIMLQKAYTAIKTANPNVLVISGAPAPTGAFGGGCGAQGCDDLPFLRQMRAAGAVNYMDCLGAHYNEGIVGPDARSGDPRDVDYYTRYFFGMLDTYYNTFNGAKNVCFTELGYLSGEGFPPLPPAFGWAANTSVAEHAQWLGRAAELARASGRVPLMIVWNVDFTGVWGDDPQGGYAIIRPDSSCPACGPLAAAVR